MKKNISYLTLLICATVYVLYLLNVFTINSECLSSPILKFDYAYHYLNSLNAKIYFTQRVESWGYNPFFDAGFIEAQNPSSRILYPLLWFIPSTYLGFAFNIAILLILILFPCSFYFSGKLCNLPNEKSLLICATAMAMCVSFSVTREFIEIGHFGFLASISLSMISLSALYRFGQTLKWRYLLLQSLMASFALFSHLFALYLLLPCIYFISYYLKPYKKQIFYFFVANFITIGSLNFSWLKLFANYLLNYYQKNSFNQFLQSGSLQHLHVILEPPFLLIILIYFFKIITPAILKKNLFAPRLTSLFLYFALLTNCGSQIGFADLQPLRFIIPLLITALFHLITELKRPWDYLFIGGLLLCSIFPSNHIHRKLECGIRSDEYFDIINVIKHRLNKSERLLVQDSLELTFFDSRIMAAIQIHTDASLLSPAFPYPTAYHHFRDGHIFGTTLQDIDQISLKKNLELYNVKLILVFSQLAKDKFAKMDFLKILYQTKKYTIFTVKKPSSSYFMTCSGKLHATHDKIVIHEANCSEFIIKFHYFTTLQAYPSELVISPFYHHKNAQPFIKISNNHNNAIIKIANDPSSTKN